jgi:hypothetical protein
MELFAVTVRYEERRGAALQADLGACKGEQGSSEHIADLAKNKSQNLFQTVDQMINIRDSSWTFNLYRDDSRRFLKSGAMGTGTARPRQSREGRSSQPDGTEPSNSTRPRKIPGGQEIFSGVRGESRAGGPPGPTET